MLDDLDRRILRYWQEDAGLSPAELAQRCDVTSAKVARRMVRMQENGIVLGIERAVDWGIVGYAVEVSLRITLDKTQGNAFDVFMAQARVIPEVIEMQTFLGRVDVRLSVIARDMSDYQRVYREQILALPHIAEIEALMHVARIKAQEVLPL